MEVAMNSRQKSRRSPLGTTLVLPGLSVVRAADLRSPLSPGQRQQLVLETRREAAQAEFSGNPPVHVTNLDEDRYSDRRASFSKTPHPTICDVPNPRRRRGKHSGRERLNGRAIPSYPREAPRQCLCLT